MKGKSFKILLLLLLVFVNKLTAQVEAYINGPGYVQNGTVIRYEITFSQPRPDEQFSPISFSVGGGTVVQFTTSSFYGNPYLDVLWNSSFGEGYIEVTGWANGARTIYIGPPLIPGEISCNFPHFNANNDRIIVTTTPASGGTYIYYYYTWQYSTDGVNWSDFGWGETYPDNFTINTHMLIRRQVDNNGEIKYSNVLDISYRPSSFENRNFIVSTDVWYPGKLTIEDVDRAPVGQKQSAVVYYDGLGRPEQKIAIAASPGKKDLVTPIAYDNLGREVNKYMAYQASTGDGLFKQNAINAQGAFMGDPVTGKYKDEKQFYSATELEASPLNRPTKVMPPGINWGWNGKGVQADYNLNNPNDQVRIWRIDAFDASAVPASNTQDIYQPNTLAKKSMTDENGIKNIEYSDMAGHIILKKQQLANTGSNLTEAHAGWLCTYYVYDDFDRLRFVIPPKAVEQMDNASNWTISQAIANDLCYRYTYDGKGRTIEKKLPGAVAIHMVYDNRDRLVFSQDGKQRVAVNGNKEWSFYMYDGQNRQVYSGTMIENSNYTRAALQAIVDNPTYQYGEKTFNVPSDVYEPVTAFNPLPLFSTNGPVIAHVEVKTNTVNRYDETNAFDYNNTDLGYAGNFENIDPSSASNRNRGLQTSSTARILDQNGTGYLHTKNVYDDKGRLMQIASQNYLGHHIRSTNQYDFAGKVRSTNYSEIKSLGGGGNEVYKIITKFEMDHATRLLRTKKDITRTYKYNLSDPELVTTTGEKTIVENTYDELGQLLSKTLAPGYNNNNGNPYLEKLIYDYNIRGWLTGINKNYVGNSSSTGSFFGMELAYDKPGTAGFINTNLNGNIAGAAWKTAGDNMPRRYDYGYDNAGRLTVANFTQQNTVGSTWTKDKHDFSVPVIQYDANGNISRMEQQGVNFAGIVPMDKLNYQYSGNRLDAVYEDAGSDYKLNDFTDRNAGPGNVDYSYDENGNQTSDLNKGITNIKYNFLNLPELVTFDNNRGSIRFIYDAAGNKLQKSTTDNTVPGGGSKTTYSGPVTYTGNEFFISTEEGRARFAKTVMANQTPAFTFDYFIKDHLGNVRMVLTEDTPVDLYPAATMEQATSVEEDRYYKISNRSDKPVELQGNAEADQRFAQKMSKLTALAGGQKIGPSIVLKVMAGDLLIAKSDYYYKDNGPQSNVTSLLNDLANNLINHLLGGQAGATAKAQAPLIGANAQLDDVVQNLITQQNNNYATDRPKAFLNYITFDEQFKAISKGTAQVEASGLSHAPLVKTDISIEKNGWVYVFVNNESEQPVYFDNFQVTHNRGNILEENHYYPFGLTMKAISPRALSITPVNRDKYNGKELQNEEFSDGSGLEAYDFGARFYDPQIGRWHEIDPKANKFPMWSPYVAMANNPTRFIDPDGQEFVDANGKRVNVSIDKNGHIVLGSNATADLKRLAQLINTSGSKTAVTEMYNNGQTKTKIHVVIDTKNLGKDQMRLFGYHQPHDANGKPLRWLLNPDQTSGKWDGKVAFIKDEKGNDIFKEATITIFEPMFTPENIKQKLFRTKFNGVDISKNEYLVATFTHEQFHDRDEANIKSSKDNQEGRPNITNVEERAYGITDAVLMEILFARKY